MSVVNLSKNCGNWKKNKRKENLSSLDGLTALADSSKLPEPSLKKALITKMGKFIHITCSFENNMRSISSMWNVPIFGFQCLCHCSAVCLFVNLRQYSEQENDNNNGLVAYTCTHTLSPHILHMNNTLYTMYLHVVFSFYSHLLPLYSHAHFHIALIYLCMKAIAWWKRFFFSDLYVHAHSG